MKQAQEVYSREFDQVFFSLPLNIRRQVIGKIRELGSRLTSFPHQRLQGRPEFRLRVGDYRVIYEFDVARNILYFVTLGNRRDVYR